MPVGLTYVTEGGEVIRKGDYYCNNAVNLTVLSRGVVAVEVVVA